VVTSGVGVGAISLSCSCKTVRKDEASKQTYFQTLPWQVLFEQKEVLLVPPASSIL
jgi:hypothetical protein